MKSLSGAEVVISKLGGVRKAARAIGVSHSTVSRWRSRGRIPDTHYEHIFWAAKVAKVKITLQELYFGVVKNKRK